MNIELKGTIKLIGQTEVKGAKGFKTRQLIVTIDQHTNYPQDIKVDFTQDKCEMLDKYGAGESVNVHADIRGKEYNGNYYNSFQGWKIESN
jgi:hypothetical protein